MVETKQLKAKQLKAKQLKAFLVTFSFENKEDLNNVVIISHNKEEAGDIFVMWLKGINLYERVTSVVCQTARRTRKNAHMISNDFYDKQNAYVNKLFEKVSTI